MVSFLMSEGHPDAGEYPVWFITQEVGVARKRINRNTHTQTVAMQTAVAATRNKKAFPAFKKFLEGLLK